MIKTNPRPKNSTALPGFEIPRDPPLEFDEKVCFCRGHFSLPCRKMCMFPNLPHIGANIVYSNKTFEVFRVFVKKDSLLHLINFIKCVWKILVLRGHFAADIATVMLYSKEFKIYHE